MAWTIHSWLPARTDAVPPDDVSYSASDRCWRVHRVEARGCTHGSGPTEEAALASWRADVARRIARGEEVPPAPPASERSAS